MLEDERFALIVDSEASPLGRAALPLLEMGIDVLHAADPDEALRLASRHSERLGALLAPSSLETSTLDGLIRRVAPSLRGGVESLVPVGFEPDVAVASQLRRQGVRWCLWEPYEARELRFVATAALMAGDPSERRKSLRVPAQLFARTLQAEDCRQAVVCDLSTGGAYLGLEPCFDVGSEVDLEIALQPGPVLLRARVAHTHEATGPPRPDLPGGMGVQFLETDSEDVAALSRLLDDLTATYRL